MDDLKLKDDRKTKPVRKSLSPRIRFKVLQRDGFTCQYCGRTGQERELEIDHIVPVSKGGTNDIDNLQTSCKECNRGKLAEEILAEQPKAKIVEKVVYKDGLASNQHDIDYNKYKDDPTSFLKENPTTPQILQYIETEAKRKATIIKLSKTDNPNVVDYEITTPTDSIGTFESLCSAKASLERAIYGKECEK